MNKNFKDTSNNSIKDISNIPVPFSNIGQSHNHFLAKTDKLVTALYMVTDMMEKDEPIRHRLRILGTEIVSDIRSNPASISHKINEAVSLLNISSTMNFISEMNCLVLRKGFSELSELVGRKEESKPTWLEQFLDTGEENKIFNNGHQISKGHMRIGVQKGGTLMQALSDKSRLMPGNNIGHNTAIKSGNRHNFDILKTKRRDHIISAIKNSGGSATIKDIMVKVNSGLSDTPAYSEKTLQRELMSMTKEGTLNRAGEKRWTRYSVR